MPAEAGVIVSSWEPAFRHSAGRRGSHFIRSMRDDGRLLGWKTARLGVTVPPIESGEPGEWVEVGPGASLVGHASRDASAAGLAEGTVFAAVKIDGADTMVYAPVICDDPDSLKAGARLVADFSAAPATGSAFPCFRPATVSA